MEFCDQSEHSTNFIPFAPQFYQIYALYTKI